MNIITLLLRAKHFRNTEFLDKGGCAIEKAIKEQLNIEKVAELVDSVEIGRKKYIHERYGESNFNHDKEKAKKSKWRNNVIREIELTPANNIPSPEE